MLTSAMPYRVTLVSAAAVPAARQPAAARVNAFHEDFSFVISVIRAPGLWLDMLRLADRQALGPCTDAGMSAGPEQGSKGLSAPSLCNL